MSKGKQKKRHVLNGGGIAIVCTPDMQPMALAAYAEIQRFVKKSSIDLHVLKVEEFSMGEFLVHVAENVRNKDVYLFFDFNGDAARKVFMLAATVSALHRASAKGVTLMLPFIPFLRQDRKDRSRIPITGQVALNVIEMNPVIKRLITLDMHSPQSEMGIRSPFDHLPGHVIFVPWIRERFGDKLKKVVIVGPDAGAEKRVMKIASALGCERSFFTKSRAGRGDVEMDVLHGADIKGKICILNDDMVDTGGTIIKAANLLLKYGASEVIITASHGVFGTKDGISAYKRLKEAGFEVVVTDSLVTKRAKWLTVLPLARYMAHTILQNVVPGGSVSEIINGGLPAVLKE